MKLLISGAGVAAGALMFAGGTPVSAVSQNASPDRSDVASAVQSIVHGTSIGQTDDTTDLDATKPDETQTDETQTDDTTADTDETTDLGGILGQEHAALMKVWTQCVRAAASGPKTEGQPMPPKTACGTKPLGPGQILQQMGLADDDAADDETADADETADTDETAGTDDTADADEIEGTDDTDSTFQAAASGGHGASHSRGHSASASHRHHGG